VRAGPLAATVAALAVAVGPLIPAPASAAAPDPSPHGRGVVALAPLFSTEERTDSAVVNGRLVFSAGSSFSGFELWATDGTPRGTRMLREIRAGLRPSLPRGFTAVGGRVYFAADDGESGGELWVTDGTTTGTRMVADIADGSTASDPRELTAAGGRLFFTADTSASGRELYVLEPGRTPQLVDVNPGTRDSAPRDLTAFRGGVVFYGRAGGGEHAFLGRTDGTFSQLDVELPTTLLSPGDFTDIGSTLVFRAGNQYSGLELWRTDGQPGDARGVKDIHPGERGSIPSELTRLGGTAVFSARAPGDELWVTDGSYHGTRLLRDLDPESDAGPTYFLPVGDAVYFRAHHSRHGEELWVTRGTPESTRLALETVPGTGSGAARPALAVGRRLFLTATTVAAGDEAWVLDPMTGRSRMVADLTPGARSSTTVPVGALGSTAIFFADADGQGSQLFAYTAAPSATAARAKRAYSAGQAHRKRIHVKVRVTGEAPGLDGRVTIMRGSRVVGRGKVVDGRARVRVTRRLEPGKHVLRAVYAGSIDAQSSRSGRVVIRVRR
jgi:ELWxxDGT repeat protein